MGSNQQRAILALLLIAFRRLVQDAAAAHAAGQSADGLELLTEALDLRRGACGEGLDLYGRTRAHFSTVDQEYVAAPWERTGRLLSPAPLPPSRPDGSANSVTFQWIA